MPYLNVSRPNGFLPSKESVGSANVQSRPVPASRTAAAGGNPSTDIAIGDACAIDANGNAYRAGPSDTVRGVCIGFEFGPQVTAGTNLGGAGPLSVDYITGAPAAGTSFPNILLVEDDKTVFEVQANSFALGNVNGLFNLADAAPDSKFRISQQILNISGGAGSQFKVVGLKTDNTTNAVGANARVLVQMQTALA